MKTMPDLTLTKSKDRKRQMKQTHKLKWSKNYRIYTTQAQTVTAGSSQKG